MRPSNRLLAILPLVLLSLGVVFLPGCGGSSAPPIGSDEMGAIVINIEWPDQTPDAKLIPLTSLGYLEKPANLRATVRYK